MYLYGLVPARYSNPLIACTFTTLQQLLPFFTSIFMHGGIFHLIGNMWFLYIFGDNVEGRLGHIRYLLFYMCCGLAASVIHLFFNWHANVPTIGASGAIAGVMGGYLILYPRARVLTLLPLFFIFSFVEVPAFVFLGIWLVFQFLSAAATAEGTSGIAWWAHIGGFIAGALLLKPFAWVPRLSGGRRVKVLARSKTPHLQVIKTSWSDDEPDLYATIAVSEREAELGVRKLISITGGGKRNTFLLTIPAGVKNGTTLRLRGLGRVSPHGVRGDLYLRVQIV